MASDTLRFTPCRLPLAVTLFDTLPLVPVNSTAIVAPFSPCTVISPPACVASPRLTGSVTGRPASRPRAGAAGGSVSIVRFASGLAEAKALPGTSLNEPLLTLMLTLPSKSASGVKTAV